MPSCKADRRRFASLQDGIESVRFGGHSVKHLEVHMNNSITLVGFVGKDPEIIHFTNSKVAKFSLAVKEYAGKNEQEKTLWIDVDAWNDLAERVAKSVKKGREVIVQGRLALSAFDKQLDGGTVRVTKPIVKLMSFHMCGRKSDSSSESRSSERPRLAVVPD